MGLGDWLNSVGNGIVQGIDHAGNAVGHAVGSVANTGYTFVTGDASGGRRLENSIDGVSDAIFFDGTVAGTNPAQIYSWFHDGPGTADYGTAGTNCGTLHTNLSQYADHYAKANAALQEGWSGAAGSTALQNVGTSKGIADALAQRAAAKQGAYGGQVGVFDSTKNSLVKVPDNPPPPNNPLMMDPISTASGAVDAAAYQSGARNNQQAYTGYQPPTQSHMSTIPQGDTAISTGQSNDSGSTQQQGTGISEPGAYNPSFGRQSPHGRSSTSQQPNIGPGGTQQGGSTGTPGGQSGSPDAQPPMFPGGSSTGLAGYNGPPAGSSGLSTPGGYDSGFGPGSGRGGADGGYGSGSVFAGGGFSGGGGFGGSGSGSGVGGSGGGTAGGRGGSPNSGAGVGGAGEGMAARSAVGARGAAGQGGAGAPGAGGRGGKKEEDKEHKTADYLVTEEHGTEVVGDLPPALPAGDVIG
jgi:hypothetical protein